MKVSKWKHESAVVKGFHGSNALVVVALATKSIGKVFHLIQSAKNLK